MVMQLPPPVQWMSPTPLWTDLVHLVSNPASEDSPLIKPVILRFATDDFMQEFMTLLNNEPHRLLDWQAQSETWRSPIEPQDSIEVMPAFTRSLLERMNPEQPSLKLSSTGHNGNGNGSTPSLEYDDTPLKLYQTSHQRFYLVTASLVCRLFGLPDRMLDHGANEQVSFVVRRLRLSDPAQNPLQQDNLKQAEEYAFVPSPTDPHSAKPGSNEPQWVKVVVQGEREDARQLVPGEEKLPMFGVGYSTYDSQARRLVSGLIPVGKRETYVAAGFSAAGSDEPVPAMREHIFHMEVISTWASLIKQDEIVNHVLEDGDWTSGLDESSRVFNADKFATMRNTPSETATWFIMLNLAHFLRRYLGEIWEVITNSSLDENDLPADSPAQELYIWLNTHFAWPKSGDQKTLVWILRRIDQKARDVIDPESSATSELWAGINKAYRLVNPPSDTDDPVTKGQLEDELADLVAKALAKVELPTSPLPIMPYASQQNAPAAEPGWYVIRCVFEQPECDPIMPPELSVPTRPFQMAAFFDPQAPSRPVRISMPMDTTPEGLRQFAKNGAFILSDCLACQIEAIRGITLGDLIMAVLPWPLHKDLDLDAFAECAEPGSGGMMLTLSLPIITICALIVLIVIASLLDLIFKWMPFFIALIPIPGLKREGA